MNTKDLTILAVGVGIVLVAYYMKKKGIEGFQGAPGAAPPPPGVPPASMLPPPPPNLPSASMMPPTTAPMTIPPATAPMTMQSNSTPSTAAALVSSTPLQQPLPPGSIPNQDQIMDLLNKVNKMNSDQSSIMTQVQKITEAVSRPTPPIRPEAYQTYVSPPPRPEGFQSYHNPYDNESPGDTQAMEFRLGKKAMADSVMRY